MGTKWNAYRFNISDSFAMNVFLEEEVFNLIRHGYGEGEDGELTVHFERMVLAFEPMKLGMPRLDTPYPPSS
jgi:hypothetical protein